MILVVKALNRSKLTLMPVTAKTKTGRLSPAHRWKSPTPQLAPNGKPSNLNPAQWKMVRTPEFKAWFGDWEKVFQKSFLKGKPVSTLSGDEFPKSDEGIISQVGKFFASVGGKATNPELGEIILGDDGIKTSISPKHRLYRNKAIAFAAVPAVIKKGIVVERQTNWKNRGYDTAIIAAPIEIRGENFVTFVVVRRAGQQHFYLEEVYAIKKIEDAVSKTQVQNLADSGEMGAASSTLNSLALSIFSVNENSVSKVLDENEEPRVVYIETFDTNNHKTTKSLTWSGHRLQGRTRIHGMDISIENKKGSVRRGTDKDGHAWRTKMHFAYGYIRGTVGKDKDHLDCFIGPNPESTKVYIIHQNDPVTGKYDEDKVMLGFDSTTEAKQAYLKQYDRPGFFGNMTETTIERFKGKVFSGRFKGKKLVMKSTPTNRIYTIEELKAEGEKYVIEFLKRFDLI